MFQKRERAVGELETLNQRSFDISILVLLARQTDWQERGGVNLRIECQGILLDMRDQGF